MTTSSAQRPIGFTATLALVAMTAVFAFCAPSSSTASSSAGAGHTTQVAAAGSVTHP